MLGYQLTFFTQQDRKHHHLPLGEWLLEEARRLDIGGATLLAASEGFGHLHKLHRAGFVELADQPLMVTMAVSAADAERLFQRLHEEGLNIFYIKAAIEFGMSEES